MLNILPAGFNIETNEYKAVLYLQDEYELTEEENGLVISDISESLNEGSYEISNTNIQFNNNNYWASERFALETPLGKNVKIYVVTNGQDDLLLFSGTCDQIVVEDSKISLSIIS